MKIGTAIFLIFVCLCGVGLMYLSLLGQAMGANAIIGHVIGTLGLGISVVSIIYGFWKLREPS
jgi:hypothetical protein